ncbi:sugar phosphate isomerase/epimerase and 4-hydroxyphenylpyruvate domain-containing protein [Nocardioides mangrovicus]|uniref:3-dehydroshikimate dehydratase n=1 Tax=Nocardioides mangrovicus TaxID=2478913 RepID=A0A3L8NYT3_9ACTN|nr:sugar phosphate isomerase/epimerase and 4-hydroxyphenylpyruvate domain-containing protein [Nocardioides mangrovicus]RLV47733.1 sugar phosphate isomerase/epimerase and 4-hydroxyphenylpyruvate domain-containing protein [Nocardioides mangrovicus]
MRTSIATVCLSGALVDKLHACAAAGFDGVEVFEPDLVASDHSPEEIRALADRLGLGLDLYQPFRDLEGVDDALFADNLRRAEQKFALMNRFGIDTMLLCSNVATATIDSDELFAAQLRELGDLAERYDVRIAYEALAWGRYVADYRRSWDVVRLADHPRVGLCLDSFHILSRGHDPAAIADIPGERIFFLQLADAPTMTMDLLSWSRHHRLFPGEGSFDLARFLDLVLATGYDGPVSLEVFNDVFRQTDPGRTALHARRSLTWLEDRTAHRSPALGLRLLPPAAPPSGVDFVEVKAEDTTDVEVLLEQLGFDFGGRHRSKPVRLWSQGEARVVVNEQGARGQLPHLAALGFGVADADAAADRAAVLRAPRVARRTYRSELTLTAVAAPDGTEVFFCPTSADWVSEFEEGTPAAGESLVTRVDHVNLAQPWDDFDEAVLFYASTLGLVADAGTEVAGPRGLVRSQVMRTEDCCVRLPLNVAPVSEEGLLPQHVAFACTDVVALAERARAAGLVSLPVPANYYDDLMARFDLDPALLARLRELDLLYDRDAHGELLHFYTPTVAGVFFEALERRGDYAGYGAPNAPVRLAAQQRSTPQTLP